MQLEKDCNDCVYSTKEDCTGDVVKCEYPMPHALTFGSMFTSCSNGIGCPVLKTKVDLANESTHIITTNKE